MIRCSWVSIATKGLASGIDDDDDDDNNDGWVRQRFGEDNIRYGETAFPYK